MAPWQADFTLAGSPFRSISDIGLVRELERTAIDVLSLDFTKSLPRGTRDLMVRFWALSDELDRRELPTSVAVEQCRFSFPPL